MDELLKEPPLDLLHRARYQVRDQIQAHLADHYPNWAKDRYDEIKSGAANKKLVADPDVAFVVPTELKLSAAQCNASYRKSVFECPGKLNNQEAEFVTDPDGPDNILCWYRNADKGECALQGHRRAKVNPDFLGDLHRLLAALTFVQNQVGDHKRPHPIGTG